jgi:uncharacterized small protein (DUF1192 family)
VADELSEAKKAVARGRADEALVHLWNALEPARLAEDAGELVMIGRLAQRIGEFGDEGERRDAERLLEAVRSAAEDEREPEATVALPGTNGDGGFLPEEEAAAEVEDAESEPGGRFARYALPLVFLIIVIVNVLAGLLGDGD